MTNTADKITVGELVARFLESCGLNAAFGVISIHNMPILDAIGIRNKMRFVPARGEAGALNMADSYARVTGGLGVAFTSTGTAAGNAAGAMVEAITAGTPVLHITGQIESAHIGRDRAYIHEAPAQLEMLQAVSKAAYTIMSPNNALDVLRQAAREALTPPRGPVSIEIPIDVQKALINIPEDISPLPLKPLTNQTDGIDDLAKMLKAAKRPMMLFGGGAKHASEEATKLANMGIGVVTSTNGRAIVPEDLPHSLGAFNASPQVEELYKQCDLFLVIGSRLRSNETWTYELKMPENMVVIDAEPQADQRVYKNKYFICGDAKDTLSALLDQLDTPLQVDPDFLENIANAKEIMINNLRNGLGSYTTLVDTLQTQIPDDAVWVRDVTISNSTWGNRYLKINHPRNGVHALGGGIGQGVPMAIGAATGAGDRKTLLLTGDGGFCLCLGELITAADEQTNLTILMMNDSGYGVIRNIQDAEYGERHYYSNILIPEFSKICESIDIKHWKVTSLDDFSQTLNLALNENGPTMVEVDMTTIGHYKAKFAGPPKSETR